MHTIVFFYSKNDAKSMRVVHLVKELVKKREDISLIGYDTRTEAGLSQAIKKRINMIPSLIIDDVAVIEGMLQSEKQILHYLRKD